MAWLGSGPYLVGRIGSGAHASASFHVSPVCFAFLGPNFHYTMTSCCNGRPLWWWIGILCRLLAVSGVCITPLTASSLRWWIGILCRLLAVSGVCITPLTASSLRWWIRILCRLLAVNGVCITPLTASSLRWCWIGILCRLLAVKWCLHNTTHSE